MNDPRYLEQAQRDYQESRILSAHPVEIVEMLYQVAIDNLHESIAQLKSGDRFARARAITKAQEAVHELAISIDHSVNAPFTHTLADLYQYVLHQITMGHARESERDLQDALSILTSLAGTWSEVRRKVCEEARAAEEPAPEPEYRESAPSPYGEPAPVAAGSRNWSC